MIYFDHAASSPIPGNVIGILTKSLKEDFANPSSLHKIGKNLSGRIEDCRKFLLKSVDCEYGFDFVFTSSATESNNMVIKGLSLNVGDMVIVSQADHPSITEPAAGLEDVGLKVKYFRLNKGGIIDESFFSEISSQKAKLALLTFINNQSGTINDITSISKSLRLLFPDLFIHVDAVQGFGKFPMNFTDWDIDSISVSSHKIGGPKGIAGLYLKKGSYIKPLLSGGGQESGFRSSTQAAPLIFGFSEAVKSIVKDMNADLKRMYKLNRIIRNLLKKNISDIIFPFDENMTSPYILAFILPGVPSDMIVRYLENEDIYISTTSACSSGLKKTNKSFSALSIKEKYHGNVLRVSFNRNTNEDEIIYFSEKLSDIYRELVAII